MGARSLFRPVRVDVTLTESEDAMVNEMLAEALVQAARCGHKANVTTGDVYRAGLSLLYRRKAVLRDQIILMTPRYRGHCSTSKGYSP